MSARPLLRVPFALALFASACLVDPNESPFDEDDWAEPDDRRPSPASDPAPDVDDPSAPNEPAPSSALRVFVTSLEYDGNLGGLAGADAICDYEAQSAQLGGRWVAWLSGPEAAAIDRIEGDGPWHDVTGRPIFNNAAHLRVAPLAQLEVDPFGRSIFSLTAWTGTATGGTMLDATATCAGWSTDDWLAEGLCGGDSNGSEWTEMFTSPCDWTAHLYCLEQPS
jgi:hypothetical protein